MPRSLILSEKESTYHCVARCVRRAYLCGNDLLSGRNFDHRKDWVHQRLVFLSGVFTIDVLAYALMSTHSHSILRTRPDLMEKLEDKDVVVRWLKLFPKRGVRKGSKEFDELVELILSEPERVLVLRKRLTSVSWFMKSLNEYIARKANKEDECKGRFWEGRFKCQRLFDEAAVLSCAVYVDLNPIRAKIAKTPEESEFTSVFERIRGLKELRAGQIESDSWLNPIQNSASRKGFLSLSLIEYLTILDLSGREMVFGKKGQIQPELEPILERLGINPAHWLLSCQSCSKFFSSAIGSSDKLRAFACETGRSWLKGSQAAEMLFTSEI